MKKETRREIKEMKRSDIKEKQLEVLALAVGDIHVLVKKEGKKNVHRPYRMGGAFILGLGAGRGRAGQATCL